MSKISGFDWDEGNWPKCAKHGLSKHDIESVFTGNPTVQPDAKPGELRIQAIGKTDSGRYAFVVFTLRVIAGGTYIRPISARYMHQKEIDHYEER